MVHWDGSLIMPEILITILLTHTKDEDSASSLASFGNGCLAATLTRLALE
jgi:hypothetical protein